MPARARAHTHTYMHHMRIHTHTHTHTHTHAHAHTRIHHMHMGIRTHTHACVHAHMHKILSVIIDFILKQYDLIICDWICTVVKVVMVITYQSNSTKNTEQLYMYACVYACMYVHHLFKFTICMKVADPLLIIGKTIICKIRVNLSV